MTILVNGPADTDVLENMHKEAPKWKQQIATQKKKVWVTWNRKIKMKLKLSENFSVCKLIVIYGELQHLNKKSEF